MKKGRRRPAAGRGRGHAEETRFEERVGGSERAPRGQTHGPEGGRRQNREGRSRKMSQGEQFGLKTKGNIFLYLKKKEGEGKSARP